MTVPLYLFCSGATAVAGRFSIHLKRSRSALIAVFAAVVCLGLHYLLPGRPPFLINVSLWLAGAVPLAWVIAYRKNLKQTWLFGLVALALFFAALETGLRFGPFHNYYTVPLGSHYDYHPSLFWVHTVKLNTEQWTKDQVKEHEDRPFASPIYFRSGFARLKKEPGTFRIMTLGGSNTAGDRVKQYADTFSGLLQSRLSARYPDRRFEIICAGAGGYNLFQVMVLYRLYLKPYQPDLVILYANVNDADNLVSPYTFHELFALQTGKPITQVRGPEDLGESKGTAFWRVRAQMRRSRTYNLMVSLITGLRNRIVPKNAAQLLVKETNPLSEYEQNLRLLIEDVQESGGRILMADALNYHFANSEPGRVDRMRKIMERTAKSHQVPFLPAHSLILSRHDKQTLFADDLIHINEKGHRLVADLLVDALEREGLLAPNEL